MSIEYFLCCDGIKVRVCQASFCSVLSIKPDRVLRIARHWYKHGTTKPENRGGDRKKIAFSEKKEVIKNHIQSFNCRASRYGRKDAPGRKYLPSDLNVKRMYELFLDKNNAYTVATVGYHYYYGVFMNHFNLAFGYPATDTCSTCQTYKLAMKNQNITDNQKKLKTALFILHRRKARKFYSLLNDIHPNEITICFDMMENLVLPKLSIGEAYYSRQLYFYVLGVVIHKGDKSQSVNYIYFFTWMECENGKYSNMICSAIEHLLKNVLKDKCFNASSLRLFSDACYGQNKNINMTCMLLALRKQYFNKLQITHTFPERGHSYLPADRVFGRVQLDIKKRDQIFEPNEYINILSRHGKVMVYGQNWSAHDFKSCAKKHLKSELVST
ncbi:uncharacterized protein LOC136076054 [Hydra vulgaris]|uniref:Uncharacterized protein LOC136076054 n=1 Tax=Hydra vulgaris TaxID=6087 RepID=A0ABM4B9N6_HYDVU